MEVVVVARTSRKPARDSSRKRRRKKNPVVVDAAALIVPPIGAPPKRRVPKVKHKVRPDGSKVFPVSSWQGFHQGTPNWRVERFLRREIADRRRLNARKHRVGAKAWKTWWSQTTRVSGDGVDRAHAARPRHTGNIPAYDTGSDRYRR